MGYVRQPILILQPDPFRHVYLVQPFGTAGAALTVVNLRHCEGRQG
jgi:hypothetical protein